MIDLESHLAGALRGERDATTAFVRAALPLVQVRAARALVGRSRSGRNIRQEVEDLSQDVLAALFARDAQVLRAWDKERGLSLANYVGLVAEREVGHVMRSKRRSPWADDPSEQEVIERQAGETRGPESEVGAQRLFERIWQRLSTELSPRGIDLFRRLLIDEQPIEAICEELNMQVDAVYAWRSRLLKRARAIAESIQKDRPSESVPDAASPQGSGSP